MNTASLLNNKTKLKSINVVMVMEEVEPLQGLLVLLHIDKAWVAEAAKISLSKCPSFGGHKYLPGTFVTKFMQKGLFVLTPRGMMEYGRLHTDERVKCRCWFLLPLDQSDNAGASESR